MTDITLSVDGLYPKAVVAARQYPEGKGSHSFVEVEMEVDAARVKMFFPYEIMQESRRSAV
jgi:hypothetical protein